MIAAHFVVAGRREAEKESEDTSSDSSSDSESESDSDSEVKRSPGEYIQTDGHSHHCIQHTREA